MHIPHSVATTWAEIEQNLPFSKSALVQDIERLASQRELRAVFIGGSHVDGFGNRRSDVDVYALVGDTSAKASRGFDVSFLGGRHIQYDFLQISTVTNAIAQLQEKTLEEVSVPVRHVMVLHRLCNSVVVTGVEEVTALREKLLNSGFTRFCAHLKVAECDNVLQDAYGSWESGHSETAVLAIRTATRHALESLLALLGETGGNPKWIFPRTARAFGDGYVSGEFRRLYQWVPDPEDDAEVKSYFERSLQLISGCLDVVCADRTSVSLAEPRALNQLSRMLIDRLASGRRKSPHAFIRKNGEKYVLYYRGLPKQELSPRAALIWLCLSDTASTEQCADQAIALCPNLFESRTMAQELTAKLAVAWGAKQYLVI